MSKEIAIQVNDFLWFYCINEAAKFIAAALDAVPVGLHAE